MRILQFSRTGRSTHQDKDGRPAGGHNGNISIGLALMQNGLVLVSGGRGGHLPRWPLIYMSSFNNHNTVLPSDLNSELMDWTLLFELVIN
jgi:hypothetical protein